MPVTIDIRADGKAATAALDDIARKQIPFAIARALTTLAKLGQRGAQDEMQKVFAHMVGFTRQGIGIEAARKDTLQSRVFVKPLQAQYLGLEIAGGTRTPSNNTRIVSRALTLPGVGARLSAAGNLPRGYVSKLAEMAEAGKGPRKGTTVVKFTGSGPNGKGPGGFFLRLPNDHIQRLISFEASAEYKPKFAFEQTVRTVVAANVQGVVGAALTAALATARP